MFGDNDLSKCLYDSGDGGISGENDCIFSLLLSFNILLLKLVLFNCWLNSFYISISGTCLITCALLVKKSFSCEPRKLDISFLDYILVFSTLCFCFLNKSVFKILIILNASKHMSAFNLAKPIDKKFTIDRLGL